MADIDLKKEDIPFWAGGNGVVRVHLSVTDPTKALPTTVDDLLSVNFNAGGTQPFSVGGSGSFKLVVSASASASLTPFWATSSVERIKALGDYGLLNYFDPSANHADRLLLVLVLGADASADLSGKFKYLNLTAETSLQAGADARYALVRSFPSSTPVGEMVKSFFEGLRLPADISAPLSDDEVYIFEYGGYLNFAASLGVGYEMSGTQDVAISKLTFAEKYNFSLLAKVGLAASVAGRFQIEVRPGSEEGWAHVVVRKSHSKAFSIAADVQAGATFESEGLPESADEFLSALIGLNSKNWLNLFGQVRDLTDLKTLEVYLDKLAKSFIEEYTGKAFDKIANQTQLDELLAKIRGVAQEYENLGDRAVALFDKYFDAVTGIIDDRLGAALDAIKEATSWAQVKDKINNDPLGGILWTVVNQLTDGDPLGWMLGKVNVDGQVLNSLDEIKARADRALSLVRDDAHAEIRRLIALAKSRFPLDGLAGELADLDWVKLKSMTDERLVGFVERLVGQSIEKLSNSDLGAAVKRFHEVLGAIDSFKTTLFDKIKEALNSSFEAKLHAEYNRQTDDNALLDMELDLNTDLGRELINKAGKGDFLGVIKGYDAGAVKLNEGVLTHKVTRESKFSVNVVGWHLNWNYQGLDRVITEAEQRIIPERNGQLTIITSFDLQKEKQRINSQREEVYTNMLLRFVGESRGVLEANPANSAYLVDSITGMSATYQLAFKDPSTTRQELAQYLSFADEFGIAATDEAAEAALEPYLNEENGSLGETSVTYNVSFTEEGLRSLFTKPFDADDEAFIRRTMRLIVLANYLGQEEPFPTWGWSYWSKSLYNSWKQEGPNFLQRSAWTVPVDPSPLKNLKAPVQQVVTRNNGGIQFLNTLYNIEESLIKGMRKLSEVVQAQKKLDPRDFEKKLGDFGTALKKFDDFDKGVNTVFAMFDKLIQRTAAGKPYRDSSLEVKITQDGKTTTKMLVA